MFDYDSRLIQRGIGIVLTIIGLALILSDNAGGLAFVALGLAYMWRTGKQGEAWARQHPQTAQRAIAGLTVVAAALVILITALKERAR